MIWHVCIEGVCCDPKSATSLIGSWVAVDRGACLRRGAGFAQLGEILIGVTSTS